VAKASPFHLKRRISISRKDFKFQRDVKNAAKLGKKKMTQEENRIKAEQEEKELQGLTAQFEQKPIESQTLISRSLLSAMVSTSCMV